MDKQNRLTRFDELELGQEYEWVKGRTVLSPYRCDEINECGGYIRMNGIKHFAWRGRYRKLVPSNGELSHKAEREKMP
jgi:hypothetical protein